MLGIGWQHQVRSSELRGALPVNIPLNVIKALGTCYIAGELHHG